MGEDVTSVVVMATDHDDDEPAEKNLESNGSGPTKRSIVSSLVRSLSTKNSSQSTKAMRRRPQTATPTSVPAPVPVPVTKETPKSNPIHPTSSLLRPSLSLSRRKSKTRTTTTTKPTRQQRNTIEMDDNGIMLVDGVEFVNVISLKARVDRVDSGFSETEKTTTTTTTKSGVVHAHHQQGRPAPDMPITTLPMPVPISLPTAAVQG
jgi:hypothetical protein